MKITLEPHYNWPSRTVMLVEGTPWELDEVFDWVTKNKRALRASGFWMRGDMGWCEFGTDHIDLFKHRFCEG